jgi:DHA1 family bicyclomycin/chloramphenicol resistance-like MFS transporter
MLFLGGLAALGSLGIHSLIPALPAAAVELEVSPGLMQLTISFYLLALAVGQLLGGWTSDAIGRKPVLTSGALLFFCGSLGCAFASSIVPMLLSRIIQGLGGACGLVIARCIIVDMAPAEETTGRLAILALIGFVSPALAPLAGGFLVDWGSWRLIFYILSGLGFVAALGTALVPETRKSPAGVPAKPSLKGYSNLLRNGRFLRFAFINMFASIGMFGFLAGSSFLLIDLYGLDESSVGLAYLLVACGVVLGALTVGSLERAKPKHALAIGSSLYAAGASIMLVLSFAIESPAALILPTMIAATGCGIIGPACLSGALRADRRYVGTASSLFGALQIAGAAGATGLMAAFYDLNVLALALPFCVSAAALLLLTFKGDPSDKVAS